MAYMGAERFKIVGVNPNDATGGKGCLCSETQNVDCQGPFAVFEVPEMDSPLSPFPVLCVSCAEAVVKRAVDGDILAGGEPVESTAIELPDPAPAEVREDISEDDVPRV